MAPLWPATAQAADPESPARVLFKQARELAAAGDYASACPKFEQSLALEAGLGTQFNLADCWEHIGHTASAQALFIGAAASAKAAGQTEREQVLRERAAALEPRIPRLVIEVADADPKLVVKRGDLPLDGDALGKAKAVDPGSYEIVAKAPGKKPWKQTIVVPAGSGIVTVEVPRLEPLEEAKPAPTELKPKPLRSPEPKQSESPVRDPRGHGPSLGVLGLAGLGLGGVALGTVMAIKYNRANSDAKAVCPSSHNCTTEQIAFHDSHVDEARSDRTWAVVGFGVGTLSFGAAAALLFLPQSAGDRHALSATPIVARDGSFGASLSGSF